MVDVGCSVGATNETPTTCDMVARAPSSTLKYALIDARGHDAAAVEDDDDDDDATMARRTSPSVQTRMAPPTLPDGAPCAASGAASASQRSPSCSKRSLRASPSSFASALTWTALTWRRSASAASGAVLKRAGVSRSAKRSQMTPSMRSSGAPQSITIGRTSALVGASGETSVTSTTSGDSHSSNDATPPPPLSASPINALSESSGALALTMSPTLSMLGNCGATKKSSIRHVVVVVDVDAHLDHGVGSLRRRGSERRA